MGIHLYRIDDRLIHGQVVVGWGQPLNARFLVLVDDLVASSDWEKELYRMAVPPEMEIFFADVATATRDHAMYAADPRPGILITGDIDGMLRLAKGVKAIGSVNIGGVHYRILYFFNGKDVVVISHGISKTGAIPPAEITRAIQRKKQFEANPQAHSFKG